MSARGDIPTLFFLLVLFPVEEIRVTSAPWFRMKGVCVCARVCVCVCVCERERERERERENTVSL